MHILPRKRLPYLLLLTFAALLCLAAPAGAKVPPVPQYKNPPQFKPDRASELFGPRAHRKGRELPQNVLVLRVQFTDLSFRSVPAFPDSLAHDQAFFERWMLHLGDFFSNACHADEPYLPNFYVHPTVYNLSHNMAYYGADTAEESDARVPEMLQELILMCDQDINFNDYDAIIVFHAGAGQESDIGLSPNYVSMRPNTIWSTFITRSDLQAAFDPDNDDYQGILTEDGNYIREVVLVPESEFQDYFPLPPDETAYSYLYSIYGVLCHQFGHQIGLPTLFDNYSGNGVSQGIGNWGLMGTGLWNGNGNVPAQLCAWSRYYLGWEPAQTITTDTQNLTVDYFLNNSPFAQRLYKIPISSTEYFLVENRQQNPDGSLDPYTNQPSFTFALLDPSEQDYYPPPDSLRPYFNFMENRYKGCEWDFFLPGLGGPLLPWASTLVDGSGLIIWHIDENIINAYFDPDFEQNHVNFDASHKGVDVEEADGIQHLDTGTFDYYKYGGPYDTFREDLTNPDANNTYFGNDTYNGLLHLPSAESYYGGIPLEIYDISASGNQMSFSVRFMWNLPTGYIGEIDLDACAVDYDGDGKDEIFYPMPDGALFLWKNEELADGFPVIADGNLKSYIWDGSAFYLGMEIPSAIDTFTVNIKKLQGTQITSVLTLPDRAKLAAPLMTYDDFLVLPVNKYHPSNDFDAWNVLVYDKQNWQNPFYEWSLQDGPLVANLAYYNQKIYAISRPEDNTGYSLNVLLPGNSGLQNYTLPVPADSSVTAMSIAPILPDSDGNIIIQTPYSVYLTDLEGNLVDGYPISLPFYSDAQVTITDTDKNGTLDYLISGENSFAVYDYAGRNILTNFSGFADTDSLYITSGVLAADLDNDGKSEFIGAFSRNRLAVFEENQRLKSGFPVSFFDRSRNLPFIYEASDSLVYAMLPTDNGKIFRAELPQTALNALDPQWYCKNANLQRTSSRTAAALPNQFESDKLFIPGQTYVFPNPLRPIYDQKITFNIMTNRDAKVEVSVFDIAGNLLYRKNVLCQAYLTNREEVDFQVDHLSSGVYLAVMKSGSTIKRLKFAVEK